VLGRVFCARAEPDGVSRSLAFACTLAVGGLIALQPPANAALAQHVGDLGAALISAAITVTILVVLLLVFGEPSRLSGLSGFKPEYAIGGIGGAAVVAVSLVAVRSLGVAGVVSLLVAGQLSISVLADRLGWFGVAVVGLTPGRSVGIVLVAAGTLLITRP
jgi:bacterial/archaeal transporter family-2 protein